jgi:hypothetical protein
MRRVLACAPLACAILLAAASVHAQTQAPLPSRPIVLPPSPAELSPAESRELDRWLDEMHEWQRFDKRWHNQAAHDPFGRVFTRVERPETPSWLTDRCAALTPSFVAQLQGPLGDACRLLTDLAVDPAAEALRTTTETRRADKEKLHKGTLWTRLHIDGLWTTTSTDARLYGIVGSHISLVDVGRVQFFGPPGVIVLSVPDGRGSRELKMGYTWGMSVRLGDVRLFAPSKNFTLFLTMTKVWIVGGGAYDRLNPSMNGFDIAGFSLAPKGK